MEIIKRPKNISKEEWENWLDKEQRNFKRKQKLKEKLENEK